jgi:hypothetical protein
MRLAPQNGHRGRSRCLGSPDSPFARPNVRARNALRIRAGMRQEHMPFLEQDGDQSRAVMHVLSPYDPGVGSAEGRIIRPNPDSPFCVL